MKQLSLMLSVVLILVLSVTAEEFLLMETTDSRTQLKLRYVVELEHLDKTPSWKVGEALPLDQEKLLSILHDKFPELTNEAIRGIKLTMLTQNKWYYTVSWINNERFERTIVLLDGSIVEPKAEPYNRTRSGTLFPATTNDLYIGDDPTMTKRLKQRADEHLRLIAPGMAEPDN